MPCQNWGDRRRTIKPILAVLRDLNITLEKAFFFYDKAENAECTELKSGHLSRLEGRHTPGSVEWWRFVKIRFSQNGFLSPPAFLFSCCAFQLLLFKSNELLPHSLCHHFCRWTTLQTKTKSIVEKCREVFNTVRKMFVEKERKRSCFSTSINIPPRHSKCGRQDPRKSRLFRPLKMSSFFTQTECIFSPYFWLMERVGESRVAIGEKKGGVSPASFFGTFSLCFPLLFILLADFRPWGSCPVSCSHVLTLCLVCSVLPCFYFLLLISRLLFLFSVSQEWVTNWQLTLLSFSFAELHTTYA